MSNCFGASEIQSLSLVGSIQASPSRTEPRPHAEPRPREKRLTIDGNNTADQVHVKNQWNADMTDSVIPSQARLREYEVAAVSAINRTPLVHSTLTGVMRNGHLGSSKEDEFRALIEDTVDVHSDGIQHLRMRNVCGETLQIIYVKGRRIVGTQQAIGRVGTVDHSTRTLDVKSNF